MFKQIYNRLSSKAPLMVPEITMTIASWGMAALIVLAPRNTVDHTDAAAVMFLMLLGIAFTVHPISAVIEAAYGAGQNNAYRAAGNAILEAGHRLSQNEVTPVYAAVVAKSHEAGCYAL